MDTEKRRYLELADFLQTRRAKILPAQVGLPEGTRRRTPGLRREEVAQLAGVGLTWYTWLEQGRPIQVSAQVLESISRALLLDRQEHSHLFTLAGKPVPADAPAYPEAVGPVIQHVLDSLTLSPAFVLDRRWNAIAWNRAACLIFGDFLHMSIRERNLVWRMFANPGYRQLFIHWQFHAQGMLARFRAACGPYIEDPWLEGFVRELMETSPEFAQWWPQHDVQSIGEVNKELTHPAVGPITFEFASFDLSDHPGLKLAINTPLPGTDTAVKMQALLDRT